MCLHGLDILSMWMLFFSLLCATASALQHSHLAKDVEVFVTNCMNNPRSCSVGVDEMRVFTIVCILCADHVFLVSLVPLSRIQQFCHAFFGLHANIVEEYVLLSAHDQSCLQSSPCFQHQFVWLFFFLEPLFARVGYLFFSCTWEHESRVFEPALRCCVTHA